MLKQLKNQVLVNSKILLTTHQRVILLLKLIASPLGCNLGPPGPPYLDISFFAILGSAPSISEEVLTNTQCNLTIGLSIVRSLLSSESDTKTFFCHYCFYRAFIVHSMQIYTIEQICSKLEKISAWSWVLMINQGPFIDINDTQCYCSYI